MLSIPAGGVTGTVEKKEGALLFVPGDASPPFCGPGAQTEVVETGAYFGHHDNEADNFKCMDGAKPGAPAPLQSFEKNSPRKGSAQAGLSPSLTDCIIWQNSAENEQKFFCKMMFPAADHLSSGEKEIRRLSAFWNIDLKSKKMKT